MKWRQTTCQLGVRVVQQTLRTARCYALDIIEQKEIGKKLKNMNKQIFTIGYEIPTLSNKDIDFYKDLSLMDADILLISPDSLEPRGDWVSFTQSDDGCYNVDASKTYINKMSRLRKEMQDHLSSGKNIFLLLSKEEKFRLANGVSSPKKGQHTYSTETFSNYSVLPISIGSLTSASGKHVEFAGDPIFSDFYKNFNKHLEYQLYIENSKEARIIFTGKDKAKILGAVYKVGSGHIVALPYLGYDEKKFIKYDKVKKGNFWTDEACKFGKMLIDCLLKIDQQLANVIDKTPPPEWVLDTKFSTEKETLIKNVIEKNLDDIKKIEKKNDELKQTLKNEEILKDLLFENGKPLECAVIESLKILGYEAGSYNDGELELDQVIISPEKIRFIGECEGKDDKDINITKFRQLVESLNADFARDEVDEKALGILFGNSERLKIPEERTLDFTKKCKIGAEREKIALIKTVDLFYVAKYLKENLDADFQKKCRDAIYNGLGEIVVFPEIPKNE